MKLSTQQTKKRANLAQMEPVKPLFPDKDLRFLTSVSWWQAAFQISRRFSRLCILPAALLFAGHCLILSAIIPFQMKIDATSGEALQMLLFLLIGVLVALLVGLTLSLCALTIWLYRLTEFTHTCLAVSPTPDEAAFRESLDWLKERKSFINKLWVYGSMFMLLPLIPPALIYALNYTSSFYIQIGIPLPRVPQWLYLCISFLGSLVAFGFMFTLQVFSVHSTLTPGATATRAILETIKAAPQLATVTAVVIVLNILVSAPQSLLSISDAVSHNLLFAYASQAWLSITSCILWPLSTTPYLKLAGWSSK